jgi:hypothetical protein
LRGVWGRMFGALMGSARDRAGLSVERAAWLADMYPEAWTSMEAGDLLPNTREELEFIAAALDIEWQTMASIIQMCRQAWGVQ